MANPEKQQKRLSSLLNLIDTPSKLEKPPPRNHITVPSPNQSPLLTPQYPDSRPPSSLGNSRPSSPFQSLSPSRGTSPARNEKRRSWLPSSRNTSDDETEGPRYWIVKPGNKKEPYDPTVLASSVTVRHTHYTMSDACLLTPDLRCPNCGMSMAILWSSCRPKQPTNRLHSESSPPSSRHHSPWSSKHMAASQPSTDMYPWRRLSARYLFRRRLPRPRSARVEAQARLLHGAPVGQISEQNFDPSSKQTPSSSTFPPWPQQTRRVAPRRLKRSYRSETSLPSSPASRLLPRRSVQRTCRSSETLPPISPDTSSRT